MMKDSSWETCNDTTTLWWARAERSISRPPSQFHKVISPLCEPVTALTDLRKTAIQETEAAWLWTHLLVEISHSFKESFLDPDNPQCPPVTIATHSGWVVWWMRWSLGVVCLEGCSLPLAFQSLTFLSFEPDMMVLQSVVMATHEIQEEWPIRVCRHSPVIMSHTWNLDNR